jgi:hypothetical protein
MVEFACGSRKVRVRMNELICYGEAWVMRKLFRFRRYARRMERQA